MDTEALRSRRADVFGLPATELHIERTTDHRLLRSWQQFAEQPSRIRLQLRCVQWWSCRILTRILQAAIPVCAGISLEYYFSTVDVEGYGCGSKLPHNIVSMVGVMTGAASDLRPGLSQQMIEIHEPMRIPFIIETTPEKLDRIIEANAGIERLTRGNWVQIAAIDPATSVILRYVDGRYEPHTLGSEELAQVSSSLDWYQGQRGHLGFATIM